MNLLYYEIRKLFNIKTIVVLTIISILWFTLWRLDFSVSTSEQHKLNLQINREYKTKSEQEIYNWLKKDYENYLNALLSKDNPKYAEAQQRSIPRMELQKVYINQGVSQRNVISKIYDVYRSLMTITIIISIISISILGLSIFIKDRHVGIETLQYISKIGRKIYLTKLLALLISSAIITIVDIFIFMILFSIVCKLEIFETIQAIIYYNKYIFIRLIINSIEFGVLLTISSLITFLVSKFCKNYIFALAVEILIYCIMSIFIDKIISMFIRTVIITFITLILIAIGISYIFQKDMLKDY